MRLKVSMSGSLMSYRFVKVSAHYPAYLDNFYSRKPGIEKLSYIEQYENIMADAFGGNLFTPHLKKLGVDAYEIIANADPLQNAWAMENGTNESGNDLLIEQLRRIKPDVVLFDNSSAHNGDFITRVKEEVPSVKQVIGSCSAPYTREQLEKFRTFDYMITCSPGFVTQFHRYSLRAYCISHAFEHTLLSQIQSYNNYPEVDCIFCGSFLAGDGYHNVRLEVIRQILRNEVGLHIHCAVPRNFYARLLVKQGAYIVSRLLKSGRLEHLASKMPGIKKALNWNSFPRSSPLPKLIQRSLRPPLFGLEMLKALNKAKIGFNSHIDVAGTFAANMRLFEVTGVGTCLITDHKKNIRDFFEPDKEVVTYKNVEECVEKVKWLLDNPLERENIAKAGQNRTLRDHTYERRAVDLDDIVRRMMR